MDWVWMDYLDPIRQKYGRHFPHFHWIHWSAIFAPHSQKWGLGEHRWAAIGPHYYYQNLLGVKILFWERDWARLTLCFLGRCRQMWPNWQGNGGGRKGNGYCPEFELNWNGVEFIPSMLFPERTLWNERALHAIPSYGAFQRQMPLNGGLPLGQSNFRCQPNINMSHCRLKLGELAKLEYFGRTCAPFQQCLIGIDVFRGGGRIIFRQN